MSKSAAQRAGHVERAGTTAVQRTKHAGGRPSLYSPQMVADACFAARQGAIDTEIAAILGISVPAFYLWCNQHPEFLEAVQKGKDAVDDRVERSLLQRATGFTVKAQKLHQGQVVDITEYFPPDTGAAMNWLANRRRNQWRKNTDVSIVVPEADPQLTVEQQSDRQLALAALALLTETALEAEQPTTIDMERIEDEETEDASEERPLEHDSGDGRRTRRSRRPDPDLDLDE